MESNSELQVRHSHPSIYKVELTSFKELVYIFNEEILNGCSYSNVELSLVDYVTSVVEPVGWTAIWRSSRDSLEFDTEYDFVVDVVNVSLEKLEAEVYIKSAIASANYCHDLNELIQAIDIQNSRAVPLVELFVISEDDVEENYEKTAVAIEYVRFFFKHLYRPWDSEDDIVYSDEIIKSRIQLYFDIKNNILPKTMIAKIKSVLKEASRIKNELGVLYVDMNVSDSEAEIGEDDLMQSITLKRKLEKLQAKMEMLENPVIRAFVMKKYSPNRATKKQPKSAPVTYVVSKQYTKEILSNILSLDSTSLIEFEHNPESAFKYCSSGDKIYIYPGVYECDNLGWLEGDVTVQGIGDPAAIVLEATGNSEVLLNCCAERVVLRDVTLRGRKGLLSTVVLHHGTLEASGCTIDAQQAGMGLLVLAGTAAVLEDCTVCNAKEDGIQMRPQSSLTLRSCTVTFCGGHGVQVDGESSPSPDSFTDVSLHGSDISGNAGHPLFIKNVPIHEVPLQRPEGGFNVLNAFPWIRHTIEDTVMEQNGMTGIGVSSATPGPPPAAEQLNQSPLSSTQGDLDYSALSDLLSEVNLSTEATFEHSGIVCNGV